MLGLFNQLAASGSAVVLVTHDKRIIEQADRILMMEEGMLVPAADRIMKDVSGSLRARARPAYHQAHNKADGGCDGAADMAVQPASGVSSHGPSLSKCAARARRVEASPVIH